MSSSCPSLVALFNQMFHIDENTVLTAGGVEPVYVPADEKSHYHRIIFTRDYAASALHEIAHWCLAGMDRRRLPDYGYWYVPDGRNPTQQKRFEQVEIKPQALEWMLSVAAGHRFRISADNLDGDATVSDDFKFNVWLQTQTYCARGLPTRAQRFALALSQQTNDHNLPPFDAANTYRLDAI